MENRDIEEMLNEYKKTKMFDLNDLVKLFINCYHINRESRIFSSYNGRAAFLKLIEVMGEDEVFAFIMKSEDSLYRNRLSYITRLDIPMLEDIMSKEEIRSPWDISPTIQRYGKYSYNAIISGGTYISAHAYISAYNYFYKSNSKDKLFVESIKRAISNFNGGDIPNKYCSLNRLYIYFCLYKAIGSIEGLNFSIPDSFVGISGKARGCLYAGYIASGQADKAFIRRVRSDKSSYASSMGLFCLYEHRDLYCNYDDLLVLFHDTLHHSVGIILSEIMESKHAIYFSSNKLIPNVMNKILNG